MNNITFNNVIPQVFAENKKILSEVWGQHLIFEKGKCYLIEAASGRGKSTFCSYILGYRHDYFGTISYDNKDIISYKTKDWIQVRRIHVSHLFQELRLFPELTAYENVEIKNKLTLFKTTLEIKELFEKLGIIEKWDTPVKFMSYGQQQRVALIRALVQPYDFILADEPISHLDNQNANIMGEIIQQEAKKQEAGIIMTSIGKHISLNYDKIIKL